MKRKRINQAGAIAIAGFYVSMCAVSSAEDIKPAANDNNESRTVAAPAKNNSAISIDKKVSSSKGSVVNPEIQADFKAESDQTKKDIKDPDSMPPIKGFHPIKKAWRPIDKMNRTVGKLQNQVERLEQPINVLTPPMVTLQSNMTSIDGRVSQVRCKLNELHTQVGNVRGDLRNMQTSISELQQPLSELKAPMEHIAGPVAGLDAQLNWIIAAVITVSGAVAFGMPLAGFVIFLNRRRLFPAFFGPETVRTTEKPVASRT